MADVYLNTVCTIAAIAAWYGSEGLFRPQHQLNTSPCLLGFISKHTKVPAPVYAMPGHCYESTLQEAEIAMPKWNTRGWCLQERECLFTTLSTY